ncbi:MAG: sugar phosphate isomerase/epimerase family protein [Planctomycetota bacterium]
MWVSATSLSRRRLLLRSSQALAAGLVATRFKPLLASEKDRGFLIGACDWSLGTRADTAAFELAREIGLDGVQISLAIENDEVQLRSPEVQKRYLDAATRTGVRIGSLAIGELNRVPLKSDPRAAQWLLESIDVCEALGQSIVMPAFFGKGELDMQNAREIDTVVRSLRAAADKAEKKRVIIGLENWLSADENMRLIDQVGSPAVKVYYDVGNSTDRGRDIFKEIRQLGKLICEFHAKDGKHMLGQGRIDFREVRRAIDDIGYRGWIVIEAASPNGVVADYTAHARYLRQVFPQSVPKG